jgi:hypothetical protein
MADQNVTGAGCLGRALTVFGILWIGVIVLGGIGILSELGFRPDFLAGFGGSIIPALVLLAAGRALRRRAATMNEEPEPIPAPPPTAAGGSRVPSIRPEPTSIPTSVATPSRDLPKPQVKPPPKPADSMTETRRDVARSLERAASKTEKTSEEKSAAAPAEPKPARPKSSQELVEEARRRWGMDKPR